METDIENRETDEPHPRKEIHVWRRLPLTEYEGEGWLPFGRKPNMQRRAMERALRGQRNKVVRGNFALGQTEA